MKPFILLAICTQIICCTMTTTTAPDGTVTVIKGIDQASFQAGAALAGAALADRNRGK